MLFSKKEEKFITGNEAAFEGALAANAKIMCGYPITPATEILELWAKKCSEENNSFRNKIKMIQAEDETSAGFNVIGAILAGVKAFTATAGPGHILMQDPIAMAEAMRLPFVGIIMQRGGPSTGTVIYGQQEVSMASFGGNGEGMRIVYSTANPQEIYYTIKAFNSAWKYLFPTFVLGDGYQSKMKMRVKLNVYDLSPTKEFYSKEIKNLRNCFNFEDELAEILKKNINEFESIKKRICEHEEYKCQDAEIVIFAHGIVSQSAKEAVEILRQKRKKKVGLFRPITINPFPTDSASRIASNAKQIIIVESSNGHFARIVKDNLYGLSKIDYLFKPVLGINPEEIVNKIDGKKDDFWIEH